MTSQLAACLEQIGTIEVPETPAFHLPYESLIWLPLQWKFPGHQSLFDQRFVDRWYPKAPPATVNAYRIMNHPSDGCIVAELEGKAETPLGHLLWLLQELSAGRKSLLEATGVTNLAYVKDPASGLLVPVYCHWTGADKQTWSLFSDQYDHDSYYEPGDVVFDHA